MDHVVNLVGIDHVGFGPDWIVNMTETAFGMQSPLGQMFFDDNGYSILQGLAAGESQKEKSADEVAREPATPNNSLASLTLKNQFRWYTGDLPNADDQWNYTLLCQSVFPFSLPSPPSGGKANLFIRPAIPLLVDQPAPGVRNDQFNFERVTALGDIGFDIGYGVREKNGFLWAFGMVRTLPTATDSEVAGKQLRLEPEALFAKFEKWGLYGIFRGYQWNVTGWSNEYDSNTQLQVFLKFLPGAGRRIGSTPIVNCDWRASQWTVPLNLTVSKALKLGDTPLKVELEVNYYVVQPDAFGPQWMIGLNLTPVVRNFIEERIRQRVSSTRGAWPAVSPGGGRWLPLAATLPDRRPGAGFREIGPAVAETQRWRNEDDTPSWTSAPRRSRWSGTPSATASTPSW